MRAAGALRNHAPGRAPLSDPQILFVQHYLANGMRALDAYRDAGYANPNTTEASKLLKKPHIRAEIQRLTKPLMDKLEMDKEKLLTHVGKVAYLDIRKCINPATNQPYPLHELPEDIAFAVSEATYNENTGVWKYKFNDRCRAHEQIAKIKGFYAPEKVEHTGQFQLIMKDA